MRPSPRRLWRLTSVHGEPLTKPELLTAGLQLHARHATLDSLLVHIGSEQQRYLALTGCGGCAQERCEPGCRVELLRRLLGRHAPHLRLQIVMGGLAPRPYRRAALAFPGSSAILPEDLLQPWPEARLLVSWRPRRGDSAVIVTLLLLVGADGPDPHRALRELNWHPWALPNWLLLRWGGIAVPPLLPGGRVGGLPPTLFLADRSSELAPPTDGHAGLNHARNQDDQALAAWLQGLIAAPYQPTGESPDTSSSPWPVGPGRLSPTDLGQLMEQLLTEPSFQSERRGQSGLSKGRLTGLRQLGLSEADARTLMVWFDRAGLLAQPEVGQSPWRAPRPFALTDREAIAAQLHATPLPSAEEVRATYGGTP
jgi:hypothetical protein